MGSYVPDAATIAAMVPCSAIATFGMCIDVLIVLRDLRALSETEAEDVTRWAARTLLRESLAEVASPARPYVSCGRWAMSKSELVRGANSYAARTTLANEPTQRSPCRPPCHTSTRALHERIK